MATRYDKVPQLAGHVVTAVVWRKDHGRFRLTQVCYEPRAKRQREDAPLARRHRGLVQRELF